MKKKALIIIIAVISGVLLLPIYSKSKRTTTCFVRSVEIAPDDWDYAGSDADEFDISWITHGACDVYLMNLASLDSYYRGYGLYPDAVLAKNGSLQLIPASGRCVVVISQGSQVDASFHGSEVFYTQQHTFWWNNVDENLC